MTRRILVYSTSVFIYTQRQLVVLLSGNSPRKFMPQYYKPLTLHKAVDNRLQFQFLNQEQKSIDLTGKEITFRILNYDGTKILLSKTLDVDFSLTGIMSLNLSMNDIENIPAQKAYYSLEVIDGGTEYPVYVDQNAGARGDLNIVDSVLPSFVPSTNVTIPTGQDFPNRSTNQNTSNSTYYSSVINTTDSPVLTIQTKYDEYYGNVTIQGSTIFNGEWYDIVSDTDLANISETKGYTINGFHPYIKMKFTSNNGSVTNILAR